MSTWNKDTRRTRLFRLRRIDPRNGKVKETRYYAQQPAARSRAARWETLGWHVTLDYGGPVRFHGPRRPSASAPGSES